MSCTPQVILQNVRVAVAFLSPSVTRLAKGSGGSSTFLPTRVVLFEQNMLLPRLLEHDKWLTFRYACVSERSLAMPDSCGGMVHFMATRQFVSV